MPQDLGPDVANRVARDSRLLVPDGPAPTGYHLTVVGQDPFHFDWRQPPEAQILRGNGSPDGVVTATKGRLYIDRAAPSLWQNTDGLTAWEEVGGGSAPTVSVDTYIDATGVSVPTQTATLLPWVPNPDAGSGWPVNAGLLTPGTFSGDIGAEVIADGYFTFDLTYGDSGGIDGGCLCAALLTRPGTSEVLVAQATSFRTVLGDGVGLGAALSFSYPCLAGDLVFARVTTTSGATTADMALLASVKSTA